MSTTTILSASAQGATCLIALQIFSRLLTFTVNQILLRYLSPELLGLSAQLDLFTISVLYFARESLRVALQRQGTSLQAVINFSYLSIFTGIPLIFFVKSLWLRGGVPNVAFFEQSLDLYCVATFIELLTEPAFSAVQQNLNYKIRAFAESAATLARCLGTCGSAIWGSRVGRDVGVLPFAIGQLAYGATLLFVYTVKTRPVASDQKFSLLPAKIPKAKDTKPSSLIGGYLSRPLLWLTASLTLQSSLKYILTQGDSLLIAWLVSLADQGAYALASNYGGLIARMVFQPIEESSRNLFAKLCSSPSLSEEASRTSQTEEKSTSDFEAEPNPTLTQASRTLTLILKSYLLFTTILLPLGPPLAPTLLTLLAGPLWKHTPAPGVLAVYCYYIPILAVNGVTEAFVASVATSSDLARQSATMASFFLIFVLSAWKFIEKWGWGGQGVVAANAVNLGCRCLWNVGFIGMWFGGRGVRWSVWEAMPSLASIGVAGVVAGVIRPALAASMVVRYGVLGELVMGGIVGVVFVVCVGVTERRFLRECWDLVRGRGNVG